MNLHHLRVFHAAAEAGGITAGAGRLNISQPAASREIRALEDRLGLALLDRSTRGLTLTEAGRLLFDAACRIFALEAGVEGQLRDMAGLHGGTLVLGASNTIGNHVLPPLLARFASLYPGIEITLLVSNSEEVAERLEDGVLHLGFVEGPADLDRFDAHAIGQDHIVAVATAGHPLTLETTVTAATLCHRVMVAREKGSGTRAIIDQAHAQAGLDFHPHITVSTAQALKNLLLAGGVAWVPRLSVLTELADGRLVELPVADLTIARTLSLITRRGRSLSPAARSFAALATA
ncbi:LysR family transcriptional regulator [Magnetospirillum sp. 64-120]|uniref:LysR family transcriptional regulator n=1 Tax=Magnetospirillum sp. 64-120 TaxID=1895778 RepID=UPI000928E83B|nr:LysR family transcriptional regulator [Magnetospirillum sp. 64-120]OJX79478.1 MAG: hypothetical protein BGO92_13490 [Magnetospirillum sp. 64-120]